MCLQLANEGKMREVRMILEDLHGDFVHERSRNAEIIEDGDTFAKNAEIKARIVWTYGGAPSDHSDWQWTISGGEPGVEPDIWARTLPMSTIRTIDRLKGVAKNRSARFVCVSQRFCRTEQ